MEKASGGSLTNQIAILMKENTTWTKSMAMEYLTGKVVTFIRVITKRMNETATGRCIGQMDLFIKVNGEEVASMASERWPSQME